MPVLVTLLRGINVGGARPLPMAELRAIYAGLGFTDVRTYLQSGNVVCRSRSGSPGRHAERIEGAIQDAYGFGVPVVALTGEALSAVRASNPLVRRPAVDPEYLHVTFLRGAGPARALDPESLPLLPGEAAELAGGAVYLYCPKGYGISRLNNAYFERALKTQATTRNWRTVLAVERMALGGDP
jgi:uncharacterized protein (DUF1697 family)